LGAASATWWNDGIRGLVLLGKRGGNEKEMEWDMIIGNWGPWCDHVDEVLGSWKGSGLGQRSSHSSNQMQRLASNILGLEFVTCHCLCLTSSLLE
jgi:hypothetical protein